MGATRNTALNELNFRGISINPGTGSTTINVVPSDSGVIFINKNTNANTNYALPAVALGDGKMWWFLNAQTDKDMVVTAPANTLVADNSVVANNVSVASGNAIGHCCFIVGDGSKYYLFELGALAWDTGA